MRAERLREALEAEGVDAYFCRNTSDARWITGFDRVFDSERAHLVLSLPSGICIHTDGRYSEAMRSHPLAGGLEISDERISHAAYAAARIGEELEGRVHVGVEEDIPLNEYRALELAFKEAGLDFDLVEIVDPMMSLRAVKDASEISLIESAQAITDRAFEDLLGWIAPGMTEAEVANELEYRMRSFGADGLAFPTIAASGPNAALPHAVPGTRKLAVGDLVVLDFGARLSDYCSDMTRTVAIGTPSDELRRVYDAVLKAHEECKGAIAPGAALSEIHALADRIISEAGYAGRFTHSLGHGVGIDVHEPPTLGPRGKGELACGNIVTVEPGVYIPGLGGVRIEDFGVVESGGFRGFTSSPHELQVV